MVALYLWVMRGVVADAKESRSLRIHYEMTNLEILDSTSKSISEYNYLDLVLTLHIQLYLLLLPQQHLHSLFQLSIVTALGLSQRPFYLNINRSRMHPISCPRVSRIRYPGTRTPEPSIRPRPPVKMIQPDRRLGSARAWVSDSRYAGAGYGDASET